MKLSEKDRSPYTRVLIFGLPGTGKSTLAAILSSNPNRRLTWICLDNDVDVLRKLQDEWQERINLVDLPDSASYPVAAHTLLQLFKSNKGKICYAHGMYSCATCLKNKAQFTELDFTQMDSRDVVVIDTGTQLGRSILAHATKDKPVDYKPERDDWGALRKWTEFFASQFQAARFNLIVICHAVEAELEDGKVKLVPDFGSKGMSASFAKAFSHVVYTDMVNKKHRAYSKSTHANNVLTKSRTDFAIEDLAEPSLEGIFPISESDLARTNDVQESTETPTPATVLSSGTPSVVAPTPAQTAQIDLKARLAAMKK